MEPKESSSLIYCLIRSILFNLDYKVKDFPHGGGNHIVNCSFKTSIGCQEMANLALCLQQPINAVGLATYARFGLGDQRPGGLTGHDHTAIIHLCVARSIW